jgi:hypothetical protein
MKTEILTQVIHLGMNAYVERAQSLVGRRTLEGKETSEETVERLRFVAVCLIALQSDSLLSKEDLVKALSNLG